MSGEEVKATDDTTKAVNDDAEEPSPTEVAEQTTAPLSEHEESNKSTIKSESVPVNPDEPKPAAAAAAATTTAAQQFDGYVCVAAGSEGAAAAAANLLEIPVENDNTLKLSTLEHSFPNAIGLKFKNEATGVFRTLAVSDDGRVILEPKGGWGTRRYVAIFR
ncbi:unnamed protein product, partial [Anisakis simplex]|uniref:TDP43_N domain-containing protein n=1 Tax=Anisakis simplex TaxID=6269 RepID=A0A0M3JH02_ANISI